MPETGVQNCVRRDADVSRLGRQSVSVVAESDREHWYRELFIERQLCLALQISSSLVTRIYRGLLEPLDLTNPQYLVLIALWERSSRATMGDLRRSLCMDTGALTPLVKRMEAAGLVQRVRDAADERRVFVDLTDKGWALRDPVSEVRREVVRRLPLTGDQIAGLRSALQVMNQAILEAEDDEPRSAAV